MEYIKNIEIKNFKSIRHQVIEGCKRINVFIGYPNTGKSNILEALGLFSINHETDFSSIIRLENNTSLFFNGSIDQPITITINHKHRFRGNYSNDRLNFLYQIDINNQGFNQIDSPNDVEREKKIVRSFNFYDNRINDFSINYPTQHFQLPEFKKYEFNKRVHYAGGNVDKLKHPYGNNVFDVISANEQMRRDIGDLFRIYDLRFSFDKGTRTFKILKDVGDDIFLIPYSMIADTLQRMIFYKAAIMSNKNSILLFEEPEAHMFPPYIRKFTSDVMFDKTNQFFFASHSPYVLDALLEDASDEAAIYLVYYEQGETKIKLMQQKDIEEVREYGVDLFFNLESYLKHGQIGNA